MLHKGKIVVSAVVLVMFLAGTVPVRALIRDDDRKCEQRIHRAEDKLQNAIRKHGEHSRQAEQRRHELEEARERCHHHGDRDHDHDRR
ncbi:MAG TPA: hypothetical protein VJW20_13780 [Candidatus Angelobacter sp.]|nr:hypothetical protein [Candidatus Angelobacter sp.]